MKTTQYQSVRRSVGLAFALVLVACSFESDPSKILAVEVGNPLDSNPNKPTLPKPIRLVQVDLQTTDLEEIDQIDFAVRSVSLVLLSSSGKEVMVTSSNLTPGSQLTLLPKTIQTAHFSVPVDVLQNNAQFKIQLKFRDENPGSVKVESQVFAIAPQTEPLILTLPNTSETKTSGQALVISKPVNKSTLFSSTSPSSPESAVTGGVKSDSGVPPPSALPPLYKLKSSPES